MSHFGGGSVSIREEFPEIESLDLTIETKEVTSKLVEPNIMYVTSKFVEPNIMYYTLDWPPPAKVSCPSFGCTSAGFDIERIIRRAVRSDNTNIDKVMHCKGTKSRTDSQSCLGICKVYGSITLKKKSQQDA